MEHVRVRIKDLREERGMTQGELAARLGCAPSTISMYEKGKREPSFEVLKSMAQIFGVPLNSLVTETDRKNQATEEDNDIWALREELRTRPEMRILFSATRNASREDILKTVRIIEALKTPNDDD